MTEKVGFDQKLGARLPLEARFRDETGRELALGELFGSRPVVLAPVYYGCPLLCGQVLRGLVRGLRPLSVEAGKDFDVVAFSINPDETPRLPGRNGLRMSSNTTGPGARRGWHFLTGDEASIAALSSSIGFRFTRDQETKLYTHAAGVVVVTSDGRHLALFLRDRLPAQGARARNQAGASRQGGLSDRPAALACVTTMIRRPGSTRCRSCG